ncbi:MAG TPA: hypothetical protein VLV49_08300 [Terriglobales bacterium]|nr:hypothetical protein [Terriglobales bacterium]
MKLPSPGLWAGLVGFLLAAFAGSTPPTANQSALSAASAQRKVHYLHANAASAHPNPAPTEFTEKEINAYLASGNIQFPAGVSSVELRETPGVVTGSTRVDFDQLRPGRGSVNPLLAIFSGVHDVVVVAHARGEGGAGIVHVDSVSLDGVEVPRFVLQLFVETFIQPKNPGIGLDSKFNLPDRIETAAVELHKLSVTQR